MAAEAIAGGGKVKDVSRNDRRESSLPRISVEEAGVGGRLARGMVFVFLFLKMMSRWIVIACSVVCANMEDWHSCPLVTIRDFQGRQWNRDSDGKSGMTTWFPLHPYYL